MASPKIGTNVNLVRFLPDHALAVYGWYYDVNYQDFFRELPDFPLSVEEFKNFGDWMSQSGKGLFVIIEKKTDKPIGLMTHACLKKSSGVFRFGIMLDRKIQNKTYAIEAIILQSFYLFEFCGCNKLVVEYLATNKHIERISEQGGFVKEAVLKDEAYVDGRYEDEIKSYITRARAHELYGEYYASLEEGE
jgi:RimJ/RimL family protein N-acetyltransferase